MAQRRGRIGFRALIVNGVMHEPVAPSPAHNRDSGVPGDRPTPMIAQYLEIKAANPGSLLFYRMGDFYELFFDDAERASQALGIMLTKRGKHLGVDIAMCGVPVERADDYLRRLIGLGHRVAVCEQLEDPAEAKKRGNKSVVRRDVVRLVTPGTITEDGLLEPGRAHILAAVARVRTPDGSFSFAIAALDISTGSFDLVEADAASLGAELARIEPREIVASEALTNDAALGPVLSGSSAALTPVGRDSSDSAAAERKLLDFYGLAALDGLGALSRAEIAAAALAISYVLRTQIAARPALERPQRRNRGQVLEIDAATRASLELTRTQAGQREGALIHAIDMTQTPAGARLLAERLAGPLNDAPAIHARLDAVAFLRERADLRDDARVRLRRTPDIARALSRLALERGGPRDLAGLRDGLAIARELSRLLGALIDAPADITALVPNLAGIDEALQKKLIAALGETLPVNARDGGFIAPGFDVALDGARAQRDESRRLIAALQAKYVDATAMRTLRIKHNSMLGFFIEVPQAQGEVLLKPPFAETFVHRQTMAGAMRFTTLELGAFQAQISSAADRALAIELAHYESLRAQAVAQGIALKNTAHALAVLDVTAGLAELAEHRGWTRPRIDNSLAFHIEGGRHPVVEAALKSRGQAFTPNDCDLSGTDGGKLAVVTGPNMAGKSTYLRQNALIVVMAQAGSFVPATQAHIGIVDRLFSRVGAADDLARGRSTFMVEMVETAAILNQATKHSLVILDEIGRGTATFDGLSIAWASVEHLHDANRARALFATHFHELTELGSRLPRLVNLTMKVTDWNGELVFLHEVIKGAADRSYGIQVARLAGLPSGVVARARVILTELEATDRRIHPEQLLAGLPLFAAVAPPAAPDPLRAAMAALDPDSLSPREALDTLYELVRKAKTNP